ncbi:glutathione transferase GstA [Propionivibrio sp.]|uniref:glutathione transferase GstA n=1 Tax=Propionivibrio sp. TaxID=2212460 RepID=UPI0025F0BD1C|nr:glutathione transferase GstA [Propionivibrio sp.]MBK8894313.1 glutathione transferase GstA [Propionivibrio sp.]
MKLYYAPGTCSFSPHITLREAGIDVELVRVDIKKRILVADGSDFATINPKGYVPVLELDNGVRLSEGPAIVQYIADLKPESNLAPRAGTLERYQLQEWLGFVNSEVHKTFSPMFNPATPDEYKVITKKNLANRFNYLASHLAKNDYLMGKQFTVADGYLYTVLGWCQWVGIDLKEWPALVAYVERIAGRASVRDALAAEAAQN